MWLLMLGGMVVCGYGFMVVGKLEFSVFVSWDAVNE